jgi:hypothetical protein
VNYRLVVSLLGIAMLLLAVAVFDFSYEGAWFRLKKDAAVIGHVMRAYGTVKLISGQNPKRLPTGQVALTPLKVGEGIQTGEDSAAEILFFGGHSLRVEKASYVVFEEGEDDFTIRLVLGRAYLEVPSFPDQRSGFKFESGNGKIQDVPSGKKLVLTLNALKNLEEAVEVNIVESNQTEESMAEMELRHLAYGEEVAIHHPLIVAPVEDKAGEKSRAVVTSRSKAPRPIFPSYESEFDVEKNRKTVFTWNEMRGDTVGYELVVRPAFLYETDDVVRKHQTLPTRRHTMPIENVGGGGVFLWSVRAVHAGGVRGPASAPRWVEIKFPKQLMAPILRDPKIK